jgi:hypothetical protein
MTALLQSLCFGSYRRLGIKTNVGLVTYNVVSAVGVEDATAHPTLIVYIRKNASSVDRKSQIAFFQSGRWRGSPTVAQVRHAMHPNREAMSVLIGGHVARCYCVLHVTRR